VVVQLSGSEQLELLSAATGRAEPSQRASAPVKIFHLFLFLRLADSIQTVEKKKRVRNRQKKNKKNKKKGPHPLGAAAFSCSRGLVVCCNVDSPLERISSSSSPFVPTSRFFQQVLLLLLIYIQ
jgi:hypothetical protein